MTARLPSTYEFDATGRVQVGLAIDFDDYLNPAFEDYLQRADGETAQTISGILWPYYVSHANSHKSLEQRQAFIGGAVLVRLAFNESDAPTDQIDYINFLFPQVPSGDEILGDDRIAKIDKVANSALDRHVEMEDIIAPMLDRYSEVNLGRPAFLGIGWAIARYDAAWQYTQKYQELCDSGLMHLELDTNWDEVWQRLGLE